MINYLNCLSKLEKGNAKREAVLTFSRLFVLLKHTTFRVSSCGFVAAEFTAFNYVSNDYSIENLAVWAFEIIIFKSPTLMFTL